LEPYIFLGGYISQCCAVFISNNRDFIRRYSLGNVFEKDFKEHWNSRPYRELRGLINKPNRPIPIQCAGCRVFNTLPREQKYGIIDTRTDEVMSLEKFYHERMGENMKWRYEDIMEASR
jgi:MoaA/NifB/PqqE/SkfB family radical SAM enzyme